MWSNKIIFTKLRFGFLLSIYVLSSSSNL
uniref:Uncharacterized protein n=1 Tax=Heterorhabditis bacteriophora TaxID=37862 RepID=A0A1I7W9D3_HETBA